MDYAHAGKDNNMARPKEFDRTQALEKAMHLFWEKGYEATSVGDLCEKMGINRGSLYDTFGKKHDLFLEALAHYQGMQPNPNLDDTTMSGMTIIKAILQELVDASVMDGSRSGCFMANTIAELASTDDDIALIAKHNREAGEALFKQLLMKAEQDGEIEAGQNLTALARFMVNTMFGLRLTSKITNDRRVLEDIMNSALLALR